MKTKGSIMIKNALSLLGYDDSLGDVSTEQRFKGRSLALLNSLYSDLWYRLKNEPFIPLSSAEEEIKLPERVVYDVIPYGLAALLAQTANDSEMQHLFSTMYNDKLKTLTRSEQISDVLPTI